MAKVFISYNRASQPDVENLAADLTELWDHQVWYDQALTGGQRWWDKILEQLRETEIFLFVLTPESLESQACCRELAYADALGRPILPVLLSGELDPTLLRHPLDVIHCVDYRGNDRASQGRLRRAIDDLSHAPPLPDPLPEPPAVPLSYLGNLRERIDSAAALSYAEQAGLVLDLKTYLKGRENTAAGEVRQLLTRLGRRQDLLAIIAGEIQEILGALAGGRSAATAPGDDDRSSTAPPKPDRKHRVERVGRAAPPEEPAAAAATPRYPEPQDSEPPMAFTMRDATTAVRALVGRTLLHATSWKLVLNEQNAMLLSVETDDDGGVTLHAAVTLRDTLTGKKSTPLQNAGWTIGEGESAVKSLGAGALIYATGGVGAVGLLSKTVRDFLMTNDARKQWSDANQPARREQAILELAQCIEVLVEPEAVIRVEAL